MKSINFAVFFLAKVLLAVVFVPTFFWGRKAVDELPRLFISPRCISLISELLEYKLDVKERDHAVDALRYVLKLQVAAPLRAFKFG